MANPIELPPNLLRRLYRGGGRLAGFRGDAGLEITSDACEDWVGSTTQAWHPAHRPGRGEGLSRAVDGRLLRDLLDAPSPVLVKLLDAGERLPIHCHPTRAFARRFLHSAWGKAEAWIVLETWQVQGAPPPTLWIGWRDGVTRQKLGSWIKEQDGAAMRAAMAARPALAGDVWFVPPGTPHAIGAGVFMVEVQEPTDFSIVAEFSGFDLDEEDARLHLRWDDILDAFDREPMPDARLDALRQPGGDRILGPEAEAFFRADRLRLEGASAWPYAGDYAVGVVVRGRGSIGQLDLRRGVTFAMPPGGIAASLRGRALELIVCRGGTNPPE
jgi:mannose-6-phosphate isomerase